MCSFNRGGGGTRLVARKCTHPCQNEQILCQMKQIVPISLHGKENVILIPRQELLSRKNLIFWPEEFSRDSAMSQLILQNSV